MRRDGSLIFLSCQHSSAALRNLFLDIQVCLKHSLLDMLEKHKLHPFYCHSIAYRWEEQFICIFVYFSSQIPS